MTTADLECIYFHAEKRREDFDHRGVGLSGFGSGADLDLQRVAIAADDAVAAGAGDYLNVKGGHSAWILDDRSRKSKGGAGTPRSRGGFGSFGCIALAGR